MKLVFNKILLFFLTIILIILGTEGFWYLRLKDKNRKLKQKTAVVNTVKNKNMDNSLNNFLNSKKDLAVFGDCVLGENIGKKGFLVKVVFDRVDLDNKQILTFCDKKKMPKLILTVASIYYLEQAHHPEFNAGFIKHHSYQKEAPASFFSKIKTGEEVQINIYEKSGNYYVNTISK